MGCIPSKSISISSYENKRIEAILRKSPDNVTDKDIETLKLFLKQYNNESETRKPMLLINDINDKLEEVYKDKSAPSITDFDISVAKLKSEMRKMNEKLRRLEGEKQHYLGLALDAKKTDVNASKAYGKLAKSKVSQMERTYGIITRLEDNLSTLDAAKATNEMVNIMDSVATALESIQEDIGSKEDVEGMMDHLKDLEEKVTNLDGIIGDNISDVDDVENELDKEIANETMKQLDLPEIPSTIIEADEEKKEEKKDSSRVAVLE